MQTSALILRRTVRRLPRREGAFLGAARRRVGVALAPSSATDAAAAAAAPFSTSAAPKPSSKAKPLRRRREYEGKAKVFGANPRFGNLEAPVDYGDDVDGYLESRASLSPWVPVPDVVARKIFDLAGAAPDDVHVDLGSGDGRVNFHAIDYGVSKSVGIDSDENMVDVALNRLAKRHPQPDVTFLVGDLLDPSQAAGLWNVIDQATIITMYFAEPGLLKLRPLLEERLAGRNCRVVTIGYEMPSWQSSVQEVVLGTQIHLYNFGRGSSSAVGQFDAATAADGDDEEEDFSLLIDGDEFIFEKPEEMTKSPLESRPEFQGSKIIDHTGKYPIQGFNPNILNSDDDGDDDDDDWDDIADGNGEDEDEDRDDARQKPEEEDTAATTPTQKQ